MATSVIKWNQGEGNIVATYEGSGNGPIAITLEPNTGDARQQEITIETADESKIVTILVKQAGGVVQHTYTRLTFIESTGSQYINTGYIVQEDDVIEMQYIKTAQVSADQVLFGCSDSNGALWYDIYSNSAYVRFGSDSSVTMSNARQKNRVTLQRGKANVDGTTATLPEDGMPQVPLCLFARSSGDSIVQYGAYKSVGCTITKTSGEAVMKLRPCKRDSDGAIGMLDLVSGIFFGNLGSGDDFSYGGEAHITKDYEIVDYIAFNNDKIYDTGVYGNERTYFELLFERTDTSGADYIFGTSSGNRITGYLTTSGYWRYGSGYPTFNTNNKLLTYAEVTPGKTTVNHSSKTFSVGNAFQTQWPIPVGGHKPSSGVATKTFQGYLYYFRMRIDDDYVADWIPCKRLSDGVEGFWDCVTQQFVEPI